MKIWFQNRRYKTKRKHLTAQYESNNSEDYNDDDPNETNNENDEDDDDDDDEEDLNLSEQEEIEDTKSFIDEEEAKQAAKSKTNNNSNGLAFKPSHSSGNVFSKNFYKLLSQNQHFHQHIAHELPTLSCLQHLKSQSVEAASHQHNKNAVAALAKKAGSVKENEQNELLSSSSPASSNEPPPRTNPNLNGNNFLPSLLSSLNGASSGMSPLDAFNAFSALSMAQQMLAATTHPNHPNHLMQQIMNGPPEQAHSMSAPNQALAALTSFYNNCGKSSEFASGLPPPPPLPLPQLQAPAMNLPLPNSSSLSPGSSANNATFYQRSYLDALRFYKSAYSNATAAAASTSNSTAN